MDGVVHNGMVADQREPAARRAVQILWELEEGSTLTVGEIQERHCVSEGTARRSFDTVSTHPAVVVEAERPARLCYRNPLLARHPAARTTAVISSCLASSLSSLFSGLKYDTYMRSLRDQFVRHAGLSHSPDHLDRKFMFLAGGGELAVTSSAHLLDDILEGILRSRELETVYSDFDGETTTLTLQPLSLVVHQHQLYMVAFHERHGRYHPYRVARFRSVELTERSFAYPEAEDYQPSKLFEDSFGIFVTNGRPLKVRILLHQRWATYAASHRWHPTQRTRSRRDGRVEVELRTAICAELLQWVLGFGSEAEVVAPKSLRDAVRHEVEALHRRYRV